MSRGCDKREAYIVRNTAAGKGRYQVATPSDSCLRVLSYGRIILTKDDGEVRVSTDGKEYGLVCASGAGTVEAGRKTFAVRRHDSVYIPSNSEFVVKTETAIDLVECSADSDLKSDPVLVRIEDVKKDPKLHRVVGEQPQRREFHALIGPQVNASRVFIGLTRGAAGNWTSWPPHDHTRTREEIYLYYDMPAPGFGIQLVYDDLNDIKLVDVVRDGDAVLIPHGYHTNVAIPGYSVNYIWMLGEFDPKTGRNMSDSIIQPEFAGE
ncbi:MAG: 5-deoxy-glucuronate isomerase [Clostridia bacterium]